MGIMQNYGGVKAAERENGYLKRVEGIDDEHAVEDPWWATPQANLILVPIFSIMDGMVLYSIFDACLTQSAAMGIIMAFGVAVVLNVLPLISAKFAHQAIYKLKRHALTMLIISLAGFFLLFAGTVMLRFAYRDMYKEESQSMMLENTVSDQESYEDTGGDTGEGKSLAVVFLLSLSPLVTSIIGFGIAYVSDDEVRRRVEYHERRDIELDEAISDLEAAIETMNIDVARDLSLDEQSMYAAIEEVIARGNVLKAWARHYLAEYVGDPGAISRLSEKMITDNEARHLGEEIRVVENYNMLPENRPVNQIA